MNAPGRRYDARQHRRRNGELADDPHERQRDRELFAEAITLAEFANAKHRARRPTS